MQVLEKERNALWERWHVPEAGQRWRIVSSAMDVPLVSAIVSVHNGAPYIEEAIRSVLQQTMRQFELIVVDDGSTDQTVSVVQRLIKEDSRIKLIRNDFCSGLSTSLNRAIRESSGRYIARMDADDISHPSRFEIQLAYLERRPNMIMVGSWLQCFGEHSEIWRYPKSQKLCFSRLLFGPPVGHPAVMIRAEVLQKEEGPYDTSFEKSQDYDLWDRLSRHGGIGNIQMPLLYYRIHRKQASQAARETQSRCHLTVAKRRWRRLVYPEISDAAIGFLVYGSYVVSPGAVGEILRALRSFVVWSVFESRASKLYALHMVLRVVGGLVRSGHMKQRAS